MTGDNQVRVQVASGDDLDVRSFAITQRMSELFSIRLRVVSENLGVALDEVIGQEASFVIETAFSSQTYTGICIEMEQVRVDAEGLATYALVIAPRAWLLTQRKNYRVFQFMSEIDIVKQILEEWGVSHDAMVAQGSHKPRKFRVQYGESDFTFIRRMLEDAGISFFFEPSPDGTVMVLDDEPQARDVAHPAIRFHDKPEVVDGSFVTKVAVKQGVKPAKMTIGDLDYRRQSTAQPILSATGGLPQEQALEQFDYEPGAFLYQGSGRGNTPTADDRGASRTDEHAGARKAHNRLMAKRSSGKRVKLESNVLELAPGSVLGVADHPHRLLSSTLLVLSSKIAGEHNETWRVELETAPTEVPYRPEPVTPKPKALLESATVVGPSSEEIHTDEYGRVRVHFHWDRESRRNQNSSCWLPTCQPWAGAGFGGVNLPRIGQEVLVDFLGGDPDRPIVVGRVFTETNPPPDKLPQYKEVSGIISESTPRIVMGAADGGTAGAPSSLLGDGTPMSPSDINTAVTSGPFQAISPAGGDHSWNGSGMKFQDFAYRETFYIQAQKDLNLVVKNTWRTVVRNQRGTLVGTDDQLEVGHRQSTYIQQSQGIRIKNNQYLTVKGARAEEVQGTSYLEVGDEGLEVTSDKVVLLQTRSATKTVGIKSDERIELVVKDSSIVIEPGSITVKSARVSLDPKQAGG
ncbi:MAG: type VI secretion system tip protein VgrG [Polyangiaceae bacterium]|nr:type VI secretion system tip protein VgrG [Polyangiaceae bacterium]